MRSPVSNQGFKAELGRKERLSSLPLKESNSVVTVSYFHHIGMDSTVSKSLGSIACASLPYP